MTHNKIRAIIMITIITTTLEVSKKVILSLFPPSSYPL